MNKIVYIFFLTLCFSCGQVSKRDAYTENFKLWLESTSYRFKEYLVMEYESCGSCYSKMTKLIQDGYLDLESDRAIILIINTKKSLSPITSYLDKPNLIIYPMDQVDYPIVDLLPRLYEHSASELRHEALDIDEFNKTIRKMEDEIFLAFVQQGHNKFDIESFESILVPGQVRLTYPMEGGTITSYAIHSGI